MTEQPSILAPVRQQIPVRQGGVNKWVVLTLTCSILVGNYYAYDTPAALNIPLQKYLGVDYEAWQLQINLLYSAYSLPNTVLPFLSGIFIQSYGSASILVFCSSSVLFGQLIFLLGLIMKSFPILLIGRVIFGIGGESVSVCQSCIVADWFGSSSQVSFALGLTLTISRLGSVLNSIMSPIIERNSQSVIAAVSFATFLCLASFVCSFTLARIVITSSNQAPSVSETTPLLFTQNSISIEDRTAIPILQHIKPAGFEDVVTMVRSLPEEFWMMCLLCVLLYGAVIPFNNTASDFLQEKWFPNDTVTAGFIMSIPDFLSTVLTPLSGWYIDKYGQKVTLLFSSAVIVFFAHIALGLSNWTPITPMIALGVAYSVYGATIWGAIADVVKIQQRRNGNVTEITTSLGGAYGLSTAIYNTSLVILPIIAAEVHVLTPGTQFLWVEIFFATLGFLAAIASAILYRMDAKNGGILQSGNLESLNSAPDHN
ncbi:major facilitator superfamily domain-containing protein [Chytriomyces sp. MP71]|nr:major facilitator superfamily domain-containing protein [Chytriomyces sp. MP71]